MEGENEAAKEVSLGVDEESRRVREDASDSTLVGERRCDPFE